MQRISIPLDHLGALRPIIEFLHAHQVDSWLVGGYVRDVVRGQPGIDFDIAIDGPALSLARALADRSGGAFVLLDEPTESARVVWPTTAEVSRIVVDLVRLRAPSIDADLRLRDFTINALALPLAQAASGNFSVDALIDPTGGLADLAARQIRACAAAALVDDPLRMLRAVRFAAQLGFTIAAETDTRLRQHASLIDNVAQERIRDELLKILVADHAAPWLAYLDDVRLLTRIMAELEPARDCAQPSIHVLPVLGHLFETVCAWEWLYSELRADQAGRTYEAGPAQPGDLMVPLAVQQYPTLRVSLPNTSQILARMQQDLMAGHARIAFFKLAALLHDVAKPVTKEIKPDGRITFYDHQTVGAELAGQIGRRLRLSREAVGYLQLVVREHMRPGQLRALGPSLTRRAVYRLLHDTREAFPDVLMHALCDHLAVRGQQLSVDDWQHHIAWASALLTADNMQHQPTQSARLITGVDIVQGLGVPPGPKVGQILAAVDEAQFVGEIRTREEALELAARIADQKQPKHNS